MAFDAKGYSRVYQSEKVRFKKINFNVTKSEDVEMMEWLAAQPEGTSNYLKRLVRKDMEERKKVP